ncbi:hypothetical protein VTO73DRAFT_3910 [Trametes versicolor]
MLAEVPLEGVFEVVMIAVEVALKVFEFVRRHVEDAREHSTQRAIVVLSWIMRSPVEIAPKDIEVARNIAKVAQASFKSDATTPHSSLGLVQEVARRSIENVRSVFKTGRSVFETMRSAAEMSQSSLELVREVTRRSIENVRSVFETMRSTAEMSQSSLEFAREVARRSIENMRSAAEILQSEIVRSVMEGRAGRRGRASRRGRAGCRRVEVAEEHSAQSAIEVVLVVVCSSVEIARRVLKVASARLDGGAGEHGAEVVREVAGEHSAQSTIEVVCSAAEVVRVLMRVFVRVLVRVFVRVLVRSST